MVRLARTLVEHGQTLSRVLVGKSVLGIAGLAALTACDPSQTYQENSAAPGSAAGFLPVLVNGDAQIACNVALEAVYADALTIAPVASVDAEVKTDATTKIYRCRIAFEAFEDNPSVAFTVTVQQTNPDILQAKMPLRSD